MDRRRDHIGRLTLMAEARGYVMVRRPTCAPFVMTVRDWEALPIWEEAKSMACAGCAASGGLSPEETAEQYERANRRRR